MKNEQPEFNLSDPDRPTSITGHFPELSTQLAQLKAKGAFVVGFRHHGPSHPALWTYQLGYEAVLGYPTHLKDPMPAITTGQPLND